VSAQLHSGFAPDAAEPAVTAAQRAAWVEQAERSNMLTLRVMRWISMVLGRRIARLVLHPITLYFLVFGGTAMRESARYLTRVFGRGPTWRERYRHIYHFAATVLDRVYFLRGQLDDFEVRTDRAHEFDETLARGRGVLLLGAHFGSFEVLRALGESRHEFPVAMVMYEENAQLINATLKAVAPDVQINNIALGRLDAMLALRKWLDDGGVAGLLADRAPATRSHRSTTHRIPFLGENAPFNDGPFRLAALLRREVVFMVGLYHGANRYELRFMQIADFSRKHPVSTELAIKEAIGAYAGVLEGLCRETPYNWFNFFDFWAPHAKEKSDAA
jgi:predicted LPLAT superfamily acyltransferase